MKVVDEVPVPAKDSFLVLRCDRTLRRRRFRAEPGERYGNLRMEDLQETQQLHRDRRWILVPLQFENALLVSIVRSGDPSNEVTCQWVTVSHEGAFAPSLK